MLNVVMHKRCAIAKKVNLTFHNTTLKYIRVY